MKDILRIIHKKLEEKERLLITIDGPCACGKTTLAQEMSEILHAAVIHTDDYVIPHAQKTAERLAIPGGNCDTDRLVKEVLLPWKDELPVIYRRYDCRMDRLLTPEVLPDVKILILEGSYSNLPAIHKYANIRIFVDTPFEIREKRLRERESMESLQQFHQRWIPLENAYFKAFDLPDPDCLIWQEDSDKKE